MHTFKKKKKSSLDYRQRIYARVRGHGGSWRSRCFVTINTHSIGKEQAVCTQTNINTISAAGVHLRVSDLHYISHHHTHALKHSYIHNILYIIVTGKISAQTGNSRTALTYIKCLSIYCCY